VQAPPFPKASGGAGTPQGSAADVERFCRRFTANQFPLVVLVDDSRFTADSLNNFLWVTFTRSNPAADVHGVNAFVRQKHWGCEGALVIDARSKPHHAPALEEDPEVTRRVDAMGARGGPLHGMI
jgi:4-hydroxy-3-polyprenylbenzoate decarboxylase